MNQTDDPPAYSALPAAPIIWGAATSALYTSAIGGTLNSTAAIAAITGDFYNGLDVPVVLLMLDSMGNEIPTYAQNGSRVFEGESNYNLDFRKDYFYVVRSRDTNGFMAVFQATASGTVYELWPESLILPNCIGAVPEPNKTMLIPGHSPRVVVGAGVLSAADMDNYTLGIREQYWHRDGTSRSIAPQEDITVTYTSTSGMTETSTSEEETTKQVDASVSAGWGPVSASVSASLSQTSRSSQQISLERQETKFFSDEMKNQAEQPQMYLRWQLSDVLTIVNITYGGTTSYSEVTGQVEVFQEPFVIKGPYVFKDLPEMALPAPEGMNAEQFALDLSKNRREAARHRQQHSAAQRRPRGR